ncbi:preprotein translocase subunit SecG [Methanoculleus chikugoensis]|jgi:preprotein translocase subunit Sec61beta|uniref:Preprotein translocase subunit SecG n=1 Tax=Methanoculleus chikugoensis TaxID=118126 RepID=A0A1M4MP82_9EURY|nr:preprotein translocase subunit Sec61beta [Methanoculleus chikugoensis]MDD4567522.1 preprotein translocase subunit Sec61beta [Methanoculleus chikugoensis]SCL76652.1 preprotein translocase subunit SecG [Methanoculleus chikugoensis]
MAKKSGGRLVSSAGLVNYYDSDDHRAIHISPKTVVVITAVTGVAVFVLNALF